MRLCGVARTVAPILMLLSMATPTPAASEETIPPDVQSYLDRRRACEHFLGEEPYDDGRRRFLQLRILQTCSGINEQGEATRQLHRDSPEILKLLEPHLEPIVLSK